VRQRHIRDLAVLVKGMHAEDKRALVHLLLPKEHGCFVTLQKNGAIEIGSAARTSSTITVSHGG
jgi:hypothetical protein